MSFKIPSVTEAALMAASTPTSPVVEEEEYYSSWSLFLVCILLILSLLTSYYLQIKRIRAVHETLVSIFAGMFVGLVVRLAPGTMIRDMLVSLGTCGSSVVDTAFLFIALKCGGIGFIDLTSEITRSSKLLTRTLTIPSCTSYADQMHVDF